MRHIAVQVNAIEYARLEVNAPFDDFDFNARQRLLGERRKEPPYCDRQVFVCAHLTLDEATIRIREVGVGCRPMPLIPFGPARRAPIPTYRL